MTDKALGLIGIARKAGHIVVGDPILGEVRRGKVCAILLAADAAENTRRRARNWSLGGTIPILALSYDKETLGAVLGRTTCAMAAITDEGLRDELRRRLEASVKEDTE